MSITEFKLVITKSIQWHYILAIEQFAAYNYDLWFIIIKKSASFEQPMKFKLNNLIVIYSIMILIL